MPDPLRELLSLQERMNRLFEGALARSEFSGAPTLVGEWVPAANIIESSESLVVQAELPGIQEKDVDITITEHALSISGESRMAKELQEGNYHRIERSYGSFQIDFPLHTPIDRDQVQATYRAGVLNVTLPKAERGVAREVKVKLSPAPR